MLHCPSRATLNIPMLPAPPSALKRTQDTIHFGGDEVSSLNCWGEDAGVKAFMAAEGFTTVDEVRNYFEGRIQQIALNHSANSMFWEEVRRAACSRALRLLEAAAHLIGETAHSLHPYPTPSQKRT